VRTTMSSPFRGFAPHKWPERPRTRAFEALRRHLPLKGEDCENDDVLPLQGEVAAKRSEGAPPPEGIGTVRTTMSSPFRGRWPRSGRRGPTHTRSSPVHGPVCTSRALHRPNTVSSVEVGSGPTARTSAGDCSFGATTVAPPVRFAPGALFPQTPPVFRGELRPPRAPPAGGRLASLGTSPWTPFAGPVPTVDGLQGSTAGAGSRAG